MVTYLFGAGASHQVLPTIDGIAERAGQLASRLSMIRAANPIYEMIKYLSSVAKREASVDTYARKLYLQGNNRELNKLKVAMMVFFTLEQVRTNPGDKQTIDTRYENFFAAILDSQRKIPESVKILTWNYDSQIEMALHAFQSDTTRNSTTAYNIKTQYGILAKNSRDDFPLDKKMIVMLNGTASFRNAVGESIPLFDNSNDITFVSLVDVVTKKVQGYTETFSANNVEYSNLSFAWENDFEGANSFIGKVQDITKETTSLAIIGYSFPMFNREVDRKIIQNMVKLKTVYIQDPNAQNIRDRFKAIRDNISDENISLNGDTKQFVFPYEL